MKASAVTEGAFLGSAGPTFGGTGSIDNKTGTISFVFNALLGAVPGASGNGSLAQITFEALGAGSSALTFSDVLFLDSGMNDIAVAVNASPLQVVAVPEPAAYLLFGVGMVGVAALRHRA